MHLVINSSVCLSCNMGILNFESFEECDGQSFNELQNQLKQLSWNKLVWRMVRKIAIQKSLQNLSQGKP